MRKHYGSANVHNQFRILNVKSTNRTSNTEAVKFGAIYRLAPKKSTKVKLGAGLRLPNSN